MCIGGTVCKHPWKYKADSRQIGVTIAMRLSMHTRVLVTGLALVVMMLAHMYASSVLRSIYLSNQRILHACMLQTRSHCFKCACQPFSTLSLLRFTVLTTTCDMTASECSLRECSLPTERAGMEKNTAPAFTAAHMCVCARCRPAVLAKDIARLHYTPNMSAFALLLPDICSPTE